MPGTGSDANDIKTANMMPNFDKKSAEGDTNIKCFLRADDLLVPFKT